VFERAVGELSEGGSGNRRLELARSVERTAAALLAKRYPERNCKANVEFYTAVLLEAVGVPRELFTTTFTVGRMAGWAAHVMEQRAEDRLIRPKPQYVWPMLPEVRAEYCFDNFPAARRPAPCRLLGADGSRLLHYDLPRHHGACCRCSGRSPAGRIARRIGSVHGR
jgi:Citrate synthase, C-terminal domain